jgi:hypothetical protein
MMTIMQYLVGRVLKYRSTLRTTGVEGECVEGECDKGPTRPTTVDPEFQGLDHAVQAAINAGNMNHSASSNLSLCISLSHFIWGTCACKRVYTSSLSLSRLHEYSLSLSLSLALSLARSLSLSLSL